MKGKVRDTDEVAMRDSVAMLLQRKEGALEETRSDR
jgi:hypothetical protein